MAKSLIKSNFPIGLVFLSAIVLMLIGLGCWAAIAADNPSGAGGDTQGLEVDTDRYGGDLPSMPIALSSADPLLCKQACADNPDCKAWTYIKPGTLAGPNPNCWLKSIVPTPTHKENCISGVKEGAVASPPGAGGTHEAPLSPGWDIFDPLSSGRVLWTILDDGNLQVTFELNGTLPDHKYIVGAHFFDPGGSAALPGVCQFGGWKIGCDPSPLTREGRTATFLGAWDFGYLNTDGNGNGTAQFTLTPPPGTYYAQFTVRIGDKCNPAESITSGCAAVYRTGKFAEDFEVIVIPGAGIDPM